MAGLLSPQAQQKVAALQHMESKVQHVYGLVERFAVTKDQAQSEAAAMLVRRAFARLKVELMGAGLDSLSQQAGAMEMAARRGGGLAQKSRILREGTGSIRFQIEQEQRKVIVEDHEAQARAAKEEAVGEV